MSAARALLISIVGFGMVACDAADNTIDPGDLELRDLLGFEPEVAASWDAGQRASARAVIRRGLAEAGAPVTEPLGLGIEVDERVGRALATIDQRLDAADLAPLGVVRVRLTGLALDADPVPISMADGAPPPMTLELAPAWERSRTGPALAARGEDLLAVLANDVGHDDGPLLVVPAPRLSVVAAYVEAVPTGSHAGADGRPHLLVNPVALAALEPGPDEAALLAAGAVATGSDAVPPAQRWTRRIALPDSATAPAPDGVVASANPYSFYGSIGECAYAEQLRCESCMPSSTCSARTLDSDGNSECTAFAADAGRGYALFCINQALTISGVEACVSDAAPGCAIDQSAASSLAELANNAGFVDDVTCAEALDGCLADLYGESEGTYPPPAGQDPTPPRDITGCSGSDNNCSADPSCNATGPSCNNSFSCDSTCASSSDQSGCGGCSDSCASDSSSGDGGSGSCSSCESDPGSTGSDGCGSCSSDSSSGDSSGGCGSCSSDSSSGDSSGGCGSCSSDSSSGDSSGGCSGGGCGSSDGGGGCGSSGGGSNNGCNVARRRQPPPIGLIVQILCVLSPIPAAAWVRRRNRKRKQPQARDPEVAS